MENFKNTFLNKITFIMQMINAFGIYIVPDTYFNVAVTEDEHVNQYGMHDANIKFSEKSLLIIYKHDFERIIKACNVTFEHDIKRKVLVFRGI